MTTHFLTISLGSWTTTATAILGLYLFLAFLKQGFRRQGESRAIAIVVALVLLPTLAFIHYVGEWDLSRDGPFSQIDDAHWWVIPVTVEKPILPPIEPAETEDTPHGTLKEPPSTSGELTSEVVIRGVNLFKGALLLSLLYIGGRRFHLAAFLV